MKFGNYMVIPSIILFGFLSGYVLLVTFIMQSSYSAEFVEYVSKANKLLEPLDVVLFFIKDYENSIIATNGGASPVIVRHLFFYHFLVTPLFIFLPFVKKLMVKQADYYSNCFSVNSIANTKFGINQLKYFLLGVAILAPISIIHHSPGQFSRLIPMDIHEHYIHFVFVSVFSMGFFWFFTNYLAANKAEKQR